MDENELAELIDRYRKGLCDEKECRLVESLYLHTYDSKSTPDNPAAKNRVWKHWKSNLRTNRAKARAPYLAAAASVLLIATIAFLYRSGANNRIDDLAVDISAGGNRAILTLADGQMLTLDSSQHGIIMMDDRLLYADSTLATDLHGASTGIDQAYNEIATPRGGVYQVVLEDGTRVWLNADSKLRFPPTFLSATREVALVGEAYFEVAENKRKPFVIKTNGQEIHVLGTSFNVAAYPDDPSEQTTLVEGNVVVSTPQTTYQLSPGEQAVVNTGEIAVSKVDTSPFVAWKSGFIAFNEETLEHIMRDISRWYDVDVYFEGADKQLRFGGIVSRYAHVSEVLERLELTGQVHFKIEERGIVITQ